VPEIIDPVFAKTSQNARFLLSENERFGLVFVKTGSINSGTGLCQTTFLVYNKNAWYADMKSLKSTDSISCGSCPGSNMNLIYTKNVRRLLFVQLFCLFIMSLFALFLIISFYRLNTNMNVTI
jgi:hypothetical protein